MLSFTVCTALKRSFKQTKSLTGWGNIQNLEFSFSFSFVPNTTAAFDGLLDSASTNPCDVWHQTWTLLLDEPPCCAHRLSSWRAKWPNHKHKDEEKTVRVQLKCHINANTKPCKTQCCAMVRIQSCELLIQTARLHCELQLTGGPCIPLGPSSPGRPCEKKQSHWFIRELKMERDGLMVSQWIY